jgi:hypothetical protein
MANGAAICASAARSTVTQMLNLADQGVRSVVLGATPLYLAAVVLALTILRQPGRRLARADLELLNLATEQLEEYFQRWVPDRDFIHGCALLREQVNAAFRRFGGAERRQPGGEKQPDSPRAVGARGLEEGVLPDESGAADGMRVYAEEWPDELFEGLQFDELWDIMDSNFLMGNDQWVI